MIVPINLSNHWIIKSLKKKKKIPWLLCPTSHYKVMNTDTQKTTTGLPLMNRYDRFGEFV
jgi:hypothetical protein